MSPIQEARVPHIMQNDAAKPVPILCGPASIQAILYGLDNANFTPPTSAALRVGVPVIADQATIFDEVKRVTTTVASQAGFAAGAAGPELICEQQPGGGPPLCWVTHPRVLAAVVKQGIATSTLKLQGVKAATVQTIPEREAPAALLDSIALGVGAALLIDRLHWVVVYKSTPLTGNDRTFYYHDPMTTAETQWADLDAMMSAIVDIDGHGTSQTAVVGASSGAPLAVLHPLALAPPPPPPPAPVAAALAAPPPLDQLAKQEFSTTVGRTMETLQHLAPRLAGKVPTRVLRVRHQRKAAGSYYLLEFERVALVVVDAATHKPRVISAVSQPGQELPTILDPEAIATKIDRETVSVNEREVVLKKGNFRIDEELVWDLCDQSRSMLAPFYVVRQPRPDGAHEDTVYVRSVDGAAFAHLTRSLCGA